MYRLGEVKCWNADGTEVEDILIEKAFPKAVAVQLALPAVGWTDPVLTNLLA